MGDGGTDGECGSQAERGRRWTGRKGSSDGTEEGDGVPVSLRCPHSDPAAILLLHQLNTSHFHFDEINTRGGGGGDELATAAAAPLEKN